MPAKSKHWKVKAACVVVKLFGQDRYLYKGAVLPDGVPAADITRLSNTGLIVEVADVAAEKAKVEQEAAEKAKAEADAQEKADAAASTDTEGATDAGAAKAASGRTAAAKTAK
ncbi:hypothetical protein BRM3_08935 [Brachybacterium huguangmaarense]|uniref:Uncharacterized protein n=1 Tax=Brachybacterium huguangmaarense TaxID=1652028 RepID=A0ABY6FZA9_9MICO|nr:hypothetical protein [Brachybacterium huguangmaarense]UYG15769.1 hypothetical protein BRM3_08935 [Brachybacterium huguangmaarense]